MGLVSWRNDSETQTKFATFFLDCETFQIYRTKNGASRHFAKENDRNVLQTTDGFLASQFSFSHFAYQQLNKHINKKNHSNKQKQVSPGITTPPPPPKKGFKTPAIPSNKNKRNVFWFPASNYPTTGTWLPKGSNPTVKSTASKLQFPFSQDLFVKGIPCREQIYQAI